jgi:hypothetical protein
MLQMQHHAARAAPRMAPEISCRKRTAKAMRKDHDRMSVRRRGHIVIGPANTYGNGALTHEVDPVFVNGLR